MYATIDICFIALHVFDTSANDDDWDTLSFRVWRQDAFEHVRASDDCGQTTALADNSNGALNVILCNSMCDAVIHTRLIDTYGRDGPNDGRDGHLHYATSSTVQSSQQQHNWFSRESETNARLMAATPWPLAPNLTAYHTALSSMHGRRSSTGKARDISDCQHAVTGSERGGPFCGEHNHLRDQNECTRSGIACPGGAAQRDTRSWCNNLRSTFCDRAGCSRCHAHIMMCQNDDSNQDGRDYAPHHATDNDTIMHFAL